MEINRRTFTPVSSTSSLLKEGYTNILLDEEEGEVQLASTSESTDYRYQPTDKSKVKRAEIKFFDKIGFILVDGDQKFKIIEVEKLTVEEKLEVLCYKYFDIELFPNGNLEDDDYEHTPCSEVLEWKDIKWISLEEQDCEQFMIGCVQLLEFKDEFSSIEDFDEFFKENVELLAFRAEIKNKVDCPEIEEYFDCCKQIATYRVDYKARQLEKPPSNISQARVHEDQGYFKAFLKELASLDKNKMTVPADISIGDIKPGLLLDLVPKFEKKFTGLDFAKFKCRMYMLGNKWKNTDSISTYASMIKMDVMKILLAVAAAEDMDIMTMDAETAYLTTKVNKVRNIAGQRKTEIEEKDNTYYIRRPAGVTDKEMPYIMKPEGFGYGHPLAGIEWHTDMKEVLIQMGAKPTNFDPDVYVVENDIGKAILAVAVDDIPTIYTGGEKMKNFIKDAISKTYNITIESPAKTILGIELERDRSDRTITLKQRGSAYNYLNRHMPGWETVDVDKLERIPATPNGPLSVENQKLSKVLCTSKQTTEYNEKTGGLLWLTYTMPDFIYAHRNTSRDGKLQNPTMYDMKCINKAISCLAKIIRENKDGLVLGGKGGVQLISTVDTSYAGFEDLKSCTGSTLHSSPTTGSIVSMCKKHTITTDSAMSAEGVGAHLQVKKLLPITYFLEELGIKTVDTAKLYMDNLPFINSIVKGKGLTERSKHMLVRLNVLKEAFQRGDVDLAHIGTKNMVADILTKALPYEDWCRLREVILGHASIIFNWDPNNYYW